MRAADLAQHIIASAKAKGLHIATAESCTGGMVAMLLTEVAGASAVIEHSIVTYSNSAKTQHLGVRDATLRDFGAVSEPTVSEMAEGLRALPLQADITIAISGIAGPGPSEFKPEGMVCFGLANGTQTTCETQHFGALGRGKVRQAAAEHALQMLLTAVHQHA